jgi:glutamyl-tRNA reductase
MSSQFFAISLSHHTAPLAVREAFALDESQTKSLMLKLREVLGITESLVVSTCNRTEVYFVAQQAIHLQVVKLLVAEKALGEATHYQSYFQFFEHAQDTIQYLFEMSLGLHSKVVGDLQISNQVKNAYQWAADLDMAGPFLHRLMHTIFFANKRVAQETAFRDGAASVSYTAVALTEEVTRNLSRPKVLILGLGEIGADVCKNLADKNFADITIVNRTRSKADRIASSYPFRVADWANATAEIAAADVIISSIRLDKPFITKAMIAPMEVLTYKTFIDLSVPRSVAEDLEELTGLLVYNIDTLRQRADEALQLRLAAVPAVEAIIKETVAGFADWSKEMAVSPMIHKMKEALEQIRKEEMARHLKNLTESEAEKVEKVTAGIVQRILKQHVVQLKAACRRGDAEQMLGAINELFNLEQPDFKQV